jgi:hypothetical protein
MKKWKIVLSLVVVALLMTLSIYAKNSLDISNTKARSSDGISFSLSAAPSGSSIDLPELKQTSTASSDDFDVDLVAKLQATYGARINELNVQASLIKVKEYVLHHYPEEGVERFLIIIKAAFPEHAASIISIIDRLEIYNDWLTENQLMLTELSMVAQRGALWEKRRELFGKDAEIIWSDELAELSQKKAKMQTIFRDLDESNDMSLNEKLYQLQTAVSENYEGSVQELTVSGGMMSKAFFSFESVQQELKQLPPEERQAEINNIRQQLGFSEEMIATFQAKDEARNKRWDNGLAYMTERNEVVNSSSESELTVAMAKLREKYFKHEAITIQKEEASDFWRYKRPRVYGNN